jgi:hypothetical protein
MSQQITASAAGTVRLGELTVNRMGYGAMRLPGDGVWGEPEDPEGARRVLRRAPPWPGGGACRPGRSPGPSPSA